MSPGRAEAHAEDARSALTRRPSRSYPWRSPSIAPRPTRGYLDLGAPAARPALEHVRVMEQAVEQRGDGGGVAEELSPSRRPAGSR